ncbi:hypothetical protein BS47DRAFT_1338167 [Hydnum rufescens UP504]|uniref:Uncharacterized protein n=1 Tax=Hydnum rufescens UP504 TaxID=1448309 RepID=A0A9P6B691_9AGAM|nr:hypothetical protein BS47DRAFT_1338167 [Hydnum rufescens UP504]
MTAYLDTKSIVRLGMTCFFLADVIGGSRIIWIRALLALECDQCMMPRTYLGLLSNMDTRAIRQLACCPYRLSQGIEGPPPQYAASLLPGGRWLLHTARGTGTNDGSRSRVSCSDLSMIAVVQPSVHFYLEHAAETWPTLCDVQSDFENHRVVAVVSYLGTFPIRHIEVLYVTWSVDSTADPMPIWSRVASLSVEITNIMPAMSTEGCILCIPLSDSGVVIFWDWSLGVWATAITLQAVSLNLSGGNAHLVLKIEWMASCGAPGSTPHICTLWTTQITVSMFLTFHKWFPPHSHVLLSSLNRSVFYNGTKPPVVPVNLECLPVTSHPIYDPLSFALLLRGASMILRIRRVCA